MNEQPKSPLRFLPVIARLLLLGFTVFGLNGFLHFMPEPKEAMPEPVMALMGGFMKSGYMLPLISGTQLLCGILLVLNCFVPLALAFLAPVLVNILAFHIFLMPAPSAFAPGIIVSALELYLAWCYRKAFAPMLACKVTPDV